jgi:hypothetical protein
MILGVPYRRKVEIDRDQGTGRMPDCSRKAAITMDMGPMFLSLETLRVWNRRAIVSSNYTKSWHGQSGKDLLFFIR